MVSKTPIPAIPDSEDCLLRLKDGAARYDKNPKTYLKAAEQGLVPKPFKIGKRLYLSRNEIQRDIAEKLRIAREAGQTPPPPAPVNATMPPQVKHKPSPRPAALAQQEEEAQ